MGQKHERYFNRELSWLEFNQRVLDEAKDPSIPLLERLKFLAITGSNLDEFFMVRVGGLQMLTRQGRRKKDPSGMTPEAQLQAISDRVREMTADQYACFNDDLEPALAREGFRRRRADDLTEKQAALVERVFEKEIFPILTPIAVRDETDCPLLINHVMNVCVRIEPAPDGDGQPRYAVVPFGRSVQRFIALPAETGYEYILVEDVVSMFVQRFFPGESVLECVPFRITRNADLAVREDQALDLLQEMANVLDERKRSSCVVLKMAAHASIAVRSFLRRILQVRRRDTYLVPGPLDIAAFMRLANLKGFEHLRYEPWPPQPAPVPDLATDLFGVLSRQDVLLCHPFDSFDPVTRLIDEASRDPDVLAIKQTLYRTSRDSPIVAALIAAAERGKHVTAVVELKARFDEARNIEWARNLERAEVHVVYGVRGLKTHAKVCIVVRREPHGIVRYVHFGTGNYNEITARLYTDVSYMTSNEVLAADASSFFNAITGYSQPQNFRKIRAAPIGLRETLLELIAVETERARRGQRAMIQAKLNSLVDPEIADALYEASRAGVTVRLNVRGTCCLRPGVPELSDNITVVSIVDRFLEHSRIIHFHHGGDDRVFISSADWMPRNLDRRAELIVPVDDPAARDRLLTILETCMADNVKARRLLPDGRYERVHPAPGEKPVRAQEVLYKMAVAAARRAEDTHGTVFTPYHAQGRDT